MLGPPVCKDCMMVCLRTEKDGFWYCPKCKREECFRALFTFSKDEVNTIIKNESEFFKGK